MLTSSVSPNLNCQNIGHLLDVNMNTSIVIMLYFLSQPKCIDIISAILRAKKRKQTKHLLYFVY